MSKSDLSAAAPKLAHQEQERYQRFQLSQRIEHLVMLVSFTILAITGLPQKYIDAQLSVAFFRFFGGIEVVRVIHRSSSVVLMLVTIYHILALVYRTWVQRVAWTMLPSFEDVKHLYQDVMAYIGVRQEKARYGRYSYAEKMEYLAVVWGTVIMAITGFMMWNPIATARFLPGQAIPAAKAAHGGEAVLAILAILLWHFYHVHLRHFNRSMFTGYLTREEMEHEHPAELERLDSAGTRSEPDDEILKRRRRIFYPLATISTVVMLAGLVGFVSFEQTSIKTIPQGETAEVFVTRVPEPSPTLPPTPTSAAILSETWSGGYGNLFRNRCSTCHGQTSVGGLSLATYQQALLGGISGPAIVPGAPDQSLLVTVQEAGGHPGQLTPSEIEQVIAWIEAGAPE